MVLMDEPLGCLRGSSVRHVARTSGGSRYISPGQTWRPLCDPERLGRVSNGQTLSARELLEARGAMQLGATFRVQLGATFLCRACVERLHDDGRE
jgi:hypothetical protein